MPMELRSGKKIGSNINTENQPFRLILAPLKFKKDPVNFKKDPVIDFDESSREWRKNKIHLGNGMFKYKN